MGRETVVRNAAPVGVDISNARAKTRADMGLEPDGAVNLRHFYPCACFLTGRADRSEEEFSSLSWT